MDSSLNTHVHGIEANNAKQDYARVRETEMRRSLPQPFIHLTDALLKAILCTP